MPENPPSQIIVLRRSSIGDVLLATPLVRALRSAYPAARLRFLVKPEYAELLGGNPHIDEIVVWGGSPASSPASMAAPTSTTESARGGVAAQARRLLSSPGRELAERLGRERPTWLVDLQASPRSRALTLLLRPDRRFVWSKGYARRTLLVGMKVDRYPASPPSVAERYFEAVAPLRLEPDGHGLDLVLTAEEVRRGRELLGGTEVLAVAPGSRWATKRWPAESFAAAARRIAEERRWSVVVLGSAQDATVTAIVATHLRRGGVPALDLGGRLSLRETAAALVHARLLLTNDSGLMHVGAAVGVPAVALFGSTVPQFGFAPYGSSARVLGVEGLPCRPCTHYGRPACPLGHFKCMREIAPADVIAAARDLLEREAAQSAPNAEGSRSTTRAVLEADAASSAGAGAP